ncbi:MAG: hypothetical protein KAT90_01535, partial [Gammaproteobacteria bacterium]|nr:hypothetical protein [Gammaproteobacteria bacterium]
LTGVVQKGPFTALKLTAYPVDAATAVISQGIEAQVSDQGYTVVVPIDTPILLEATGTFTNELTAEAVEVIEPLQALVVSQSDDNVINVNPLTDFAAQRTLEQFTPEATFDQQLQASTDFVLDAFNLSTLIDPTSLRLDEIDAQASISDPNLQLLLISALLIQDQEGVNTLNTFESIADQLSQATALSEIETALGFFNGISAQSLYDEIINQGVITGLPAIQFPQNVSWLCEPVTGCSWVDQPAKTIAISSSVTFEAEGGVELVVRLSEVSTVDVDFTLATEDDSAIGLDDYVAIDQQFTIPVGAQEKRIFIPVVIDNEDELQERFRVNLVPVTAEYTVFNNVNQVDVLINNGAPALNNTVVSDIAINRLCIRGINSPGVNTANDCTVRLSSTTAVTKKANTSLAVELDLQALCADPLSCDALSQDRLVDFYLLVTDVMGVPQLENNLGQYLYSVSDIQLSSDAVISNLFYLAVDDDASADLMLQAAAQGWELRLEARVKEQGDTATAHLVEMIPVPEQMIAGDRTVNITGTISLGDGVVYGCQAGHYALTADFEFAFAQTVNGTVCVDINSTDTGVTAVLADNTQPDMDLDISFTPLLMPENHVALTSIGEQHPGSIGLPFALQLATITKEDANGDPYFVHIWLHSEGLPFMYRVTSASLTSSGIKIAYDKVRYVMSVGYSASDPRSVEGTLTEGIKSNDIAYFGVNNQPGTLILAEDGIKTTVQVNQSIGHTAYPKSRIASEGFTQTVDKGLISNKASISSALSLSQSSACQESGCNVEKIISYFAIADDTNVATKLTLDTHGALLGEMETQLEVIPSWGAQLDTQLDTV